MDESLRASHTKHASIPLTMAIELHLVTNNDHRPWMLNDRTTQTGCLHQHAKKDLEKPTGITPYQHREIKHNELAPFSCKRYRKTVARDGVKV